MAEEVDLLEKLIRQDREEVSIEDLTSVLNVFKNLPENGKIRLLETIRTFFSLTENLRGNSPATHLSISNHSEPSHSHNAKHSFSAELAMSPKEFILQKQPQTSVERVACLGYYLAHYRETPHFKTLDISKLNTEAAQGKFSNAAMSVNDALRSGYLISVAKGNKQLSAIGELFVQALPDREAAKLAMSSRSARKKKRAILLQPRRAALEGDKSAQ